MKDLSEQLRARIRAGVTTLCTCISIRRRDGVTYYLTDHDLPVTAGGFRHDPYHAYTRTSIPTSSELEVDSFEIRGILNSAAIGREDVASGKLDYAEVSVYAVDYEYPDLGLIHLRTGWVGEVTTQEDSTFVAEVRGLSQVFTFRIGDPYAPECRATLGDKFCKIPLVPKRWQPTTTYAKESSVLGVINAAQQYVQLSFVNASFDADAGQAPKPSPTGWNSTGDASGGWGFTSTADGVAGPKSGGVFVYHTNILGGKSSARTMRQSISLASQGVDLDAIDTGLSRLTSGVWAVCLSNIGKATFEVVAANDAGVETVIYNSAPQAFREDQWFRLDCPNALIPAGTRTLVFSLTATKKASHQYGAGFDVINAAINYPEGTYGSSDQFGDVCFVAQNFGLSGATEPAFSGLLGAITMDGTIQWKTVKAWSTVSTVRTAAPDNRSLTPSGLTDPAGYYDGGLLSWETGRNAGRSQEVRTWKGGRLSLFLRPYYPMRPGDRFVVRPGCDRRRVTCKETFSNVINMRAEPDVPGQDEYYATPNASAGD